MYQVGVITDWEELVKRYRHIGYSPEDAELNALFTVMEYGEEARENTKADVLAAYDVGRFTRAEALQALQDIAYPDWLAEVYLTRADLQRANKLTKETVRHVKTLYVGHQVDTGQASAALASAGLPSEEINRYLEEWAIARTAKIAKPSKSELRRFFLRNLLSEAELRDGLRAHRLGDRFIDWYVQDAKADLLEDVQNEKERADLELARADTAELRSEYDIAAAEFNVLIAQHNVAIADLKLSVTEESAVEDVETVATSILEYKAEIARARESKAALRKAYLEERREVS